MIKPKRDSSSKRSICPYAKDLHFVRQIQLLMAFKTRDIILDMFSQRNPRLEACLYIDKYFQPLQGFSLILDREVSREE